MNQIDKQVWNRILQDQAWNGLKIGNQISLQLWFQIYDRWYQVRDLFPNISHLIDDQIEDQIDKGTQINV